MVVADRAAARFVRLRRRCALVLLLQKGFAKNRVGELNLGGHSFSLEAMAAIQRAASEPAPGKYFVFVRFDVWVPGM